MAEIGEMQTYTDNGRVVRNRRGLVLFGSTWALLDPQVLDIATTEDDVLIDLVRSRNLFFRVALSAFGAKRLDTLKRDCGLG